MMVGKDDFVILAVGRLVKDKGIEELVQAFINSKIVNNSKLVLLGAFEQELNPLSPAILKQIKYHPRIVQIDWSDHVAHYMALSDVLVHASHREGFPNVLLEAGAMSLPIICSDIIGNKDLITQQKTGLIFPVKDVSFLIEALEFAFFKREVMFKYADNLYQKICEDYSREKIQQEILETYHQVLTTIK
jgi:glycosyltransferase involved in cell wall biosynthesis